MLKPSPAVFLARMTSWDRITSIAAAVMPWVPGGPKEDEPFRSLSNTEVFSGKKERNVTEEREKKSFSLAHAAPHDRRQSVAQPFRTEKCFEKGTTGKKGTASADFTCLQPVAPGAASFVGSSGALNDFVAYRKHDDATTEAGVQLPSRDFARRVLSDSVRGCENYTPKSSTCLVWERIACSKASTSVHIDESFGRANSGNAHTLPDSTCCIEVSRRTDNLKTARDRTLSWTDAQLLAARQAVHIREYRRKVCRSFSARGVSAMGLIAAQRALRAPYVMSKMGRVQARATWHPAEVEARVAWTATVPSPA